MKSEYKPKLRNVLADPDPFLRKKSKIVSEPTSKDIKELIEDMIFTMRKEKGIGLAAIQVGVDSRVLVVETKDGAIPFINPEIISISSNREIGEEGCLSLPGKYGLVSRDVKVSVKCLDIKGNEQIYDAEGLFARVLQHEIDHLEGILFTDKLEEDIRD